MKRMPWLTRVPCALLLASTVTACGADSPESAGVQVDAPHVETLISVPKLLATPSSLDCSKSPFGQRLLITGENEPYVTFRSSAGAPVAYTFDRYGTPGSEELDRTWTFSNSDLARKTITLQKDVAADLNGDGRSELVMSFKDANNGTQLISLTNNGSGTRTPYYYAAPNLNNYSETAIAAGNLDRSSNGDDEIAWGFIDSDGMTQIFMFDGNASGAIGHADGYAQGYWRRSAATGRVGVHYLDMATGDLDNDGYDDEIVLAFMDSQSMVQVVVLKYQPGYTLPNSMAANYRELASTRIDLHGTQTPELKVATGDIDGDYKDDIIVAFGVRDPDTSMATQLQLRAFKLAYDKTTLDPFIQWDRQFLFRGLGLATGDTDGDGLAEVVLAFHGYDSTLLNGNQSIAIGTGFNALTLDAHDASATLPGDDTFLIHGSLFSAANSRSGGSMSPVSLAVADMDNDGKRDIVAAFKDGGNALQVVRLEDQSAPFTTLQLASVWRDIGTPSPGFVTVALGDWTNDSIRAQYEPINGSAMSCQTVVEPQITAAIFVPPFWKNINPQNSSGSIGESSLVGKSAESSLTSTTSNSVTGYVGGGVDAEAFSVSVKASGGYEWSASSTSTSGSGDSTTTSSAWTNSDDFAIVQNHTYNCYTYQVRQAGTALDSWARFCDHRGVAEESPVLNTWDVQYSPINNANTSQWAPIVRDWSNLALFRGPFTAQSSTCWSGDPARAVDTNTNGIYGGNSIANTCYETTPWWQVDLGQSQPVGKVRVWNRSKKDSCDDGPCPARLKDFYVFVSDTDFRSISNDPNVLKNDPRVRAYYHPGMGGETTTLLTLSQGEPITGRYVRVQLAGTGYLSLAEVQVFGTNHVEPDRYPAAVRDPTPNDGEFEAELFDTLSQTYRWVKVKGNLLWDGTTRNVLGNKTIGPGGGIASWSLTQERSGWSTDASSTSNTWNAGISLEASGGVLYKVEAGISYEFSSGVTRDESHTMSWSQSFELGGGVGGFPSTVDNRVVIWPTQCNYQVRPYYYEVTVRSNDGYEHRYMTVDYTVPSTLDRSANLQRCRAGQYSLPSFSAATEPAPSKLEALLR